MNTSRSPHTYAMAYAQRGWPVFPLHSVQSGDCTCGRDNCDSAGKHPRTRNGVKDATTDEEQIRQWWDMWPSANIGIATGIPEGAQEGLYVIDVDISKGATLESLEPYDLPALRASSIVRTGSGGYHIYLSTRERLPNTCNRLAPWIDTRGDGGYVVAPPGRNRLGSYVWERGSALLPLPEALRGKVVSGPSLFTNILKKEASSYDLFNPAELSTSLQSPLSPSLHSPERSAPAAKSSPAQSHPASEARNNYLISMAGRLRGQGLSAAEICALLTTLNEVRYGAGRHPQGALPREEMQRTIFKSVERWQATSGQVPDSLPTLDLLDKLIERNLPETTWLVPGLLCEGLVLFAGKAKLGKSWLALGLALTCALGSANQGGLALGRYPVDPAGVLYLSLEDSVSRFKSRVVRLLNGRAAPANFSYALRWKPLTAGGLTDLEAALSAAPETRLVVIDTLARVRTAGNSSGNLYQEDYNLMAALHDIVVRYHLTLILVHHTRKLTSPDAFDDISGTVGLTGSADTSLVLTRERFQKEATLHVTGRDIEEQEIALAFNSANCVWTVSGPPAERQVSQTCQQILDLFQQQSSLTRSEIAQKSGLPKGTLDSSLFRLERERTIIKEKRGLYTLYEQKETKE